MTRAGGEAVASWHLQQPEHPGFAGLRALRAETGADLVTLYASVNDVCGIANRPGYAEQFLPKFGYSVINAAAGCQSEFVLAHEIGHNLGAAHDRANHDRANSDSAPLAEYGYGYQQTELRPRFRDVMAYACPAGLDCPRVRFFSNPETRYSTIPTGKGDTSPEPANVARLVGETYPLVMSYGSLPEPAPFASFHITPTPFPYCDGSDFERTRYFPRIAWSVRGLEEISVRVGSPDGDEFVRNVDLFGSSQVPGWASPGMRFYLLGRSGEEWFELAVVTLAVVDAGCKEVRPSEPKFTQVGGEETV